MEGFVIIVNGSQALAVITKQKYQKKQEKKSWHKLYTKTLCIESLYLTSDCFSTSLNLKWKVSQINLTLTTGVYIFKNLILSQPNDKTLQLIHVKCKLKWCNQKQTFTFGNFPQRKIVWTIIFSNGFLLAKNQVMYVLIGCNLKLLLIKIYAGISNI